MRNLVGFVVVGFLSLLVLWAIRGASVGMQHAGMSGEGSAPPAADSTMSKTMPGHDHGTHGTPGHTDNSPEHAGAAAGASSGAKAGGADTGSAMAGHDHSSHGTPGHTDASAEHAHTTIDIADVVDKPDLEVVMRRDPMSGWNMNISTTNFKFAPYNVNGKHVMGEGHAHVYVNGKKLARLYGPWFHVPGLPKGIHHFEITLNANNHAEYVLGEQRVSRKLTITER